jgi:DNA-binding HxlR family transcriptional regulator
MADEHRQGTREVSAPAAPAANRALAVLGGKWTPALVLLLAPGRRRYSWLLHALPGVTPKVLTQHLRRLARVGVIERTSVPSRTRHVEYALTPAGEALVRVLEAMADWAMLYSGRQRGDPSANPFDRTA